MLSGETGSKESEPISTSKAIIASGAGSISSTKPQQHSSANWRALLSQMHVLHNLRKKIPLTEVEKKYSALSSSVVSFFQSELSIEKLKHACDMRLDRSNKRTSGLKTINILLSFVSVSSIRETIILSIAKALRGDPIKHYAEDLQSCGDFIGNVKTEFNKLYSHLVRLAKSEIAQENSLSWLVLCDSFLSSCYCPLQEISENQAAAELVRFETATGRSPVRGVLGTVFTRSRSSLRSRYPETN